MNDFTSYIAAGERGDPLAAEALLSRVYDELRRIAAGKMANEPGGQTLQPTALVHEAWLRLGRPEAQCWDSRAHFFGAAAEAMRRILIEKARRRHRVRHGEGLERVPLDEIDLAAPEADERLLQIHEAVDRLAAVDPVKADVVKLRYFVGLTDREVADALGLSERTIERHWAYAKAWIVEALRGLD